MGMTTNTRGGGIRNISQRMSTRASGGHRIRMGMMGCERGGRMSLVRKSAKEEFQNMSRVVMTVGGEESRSDCVQHERKGHITSRRSLT